MRRNLFSTFLTSTSTVLARSCALGSRRAFNGFPALVQKIENAAELKRQELHTLKKQHGATEISKSTISSILGGMRDLTCILTETSHLHPEHGLLYRGNTIEHLRQQLPKATPGGCEPLPEALLWLLLTGEMPSDNQVAMMTSELISRATLPISTIRVIDSLSPTLHPMTQIITAVASLQSDSVFVKHYSKGIDKKDMWRYVLEDGLFLIARLPLIAARIYQRSYSHPIDSSNASLDLAAGFMHMLGLNTPEHYDMMRLYLFLHADHEGGNASAHTSHLVGSTLSDPYLAFCAGMAALAGPLHGLANQECLKWLLELKEEFKGDSYTPEGVAAFTRKCLSAGKVIPGYGHAVLRKTDPRFTAQHMFAKDIMADFDLYKLLNVACNTVPTVLQSTGKVKNPFPNVDCHSGVILRYFGLQHETFYTVLFGMSRSIGIVSQLVWSRVLNLPIERPRSISLDGLKEIVSKT